MKMADHYESEIANVRMEMEVIKLDIRLLQMDIKRFDKQISRIFAMLVALSLSSVFICLVNMIN